MLAFYYYYYYYLVAVGHILGIYTWNKIFAACVCVVLLVNHNIRRECPCTKVRRQQEEEETIVFENIKSPSDWCI